MAEFYMIYARKMAELYTIIAQKIFSPSLPSYAYETEYNLTYDTKWF